MPKLLALLAALASLSPPVRAACVGDLDGDCDTDQSDLGILLSSYLISAGGDLDADGDTDQSDLGILLANYGCVAPPGLASIANIAFSQLDWFDATGVPVTFDSAWGTMEMNVTPPPGCTQYLNVVANAGPLDAWIIQNYPLFPADILGDTRQALDFDITDLGIVTPLHFMQVWYAITPAPQPLGLKQVALGLQLVSDKQVTWPACDCDCDPHVPAQDAGAPLGHKAQDKPTGVVQHKNVPAVQEDASRCLAGAFARSISWLNSEYGLGSSKSAQDMYQDLIDKGIKGPTGGKYEDQIAAKQKYLSDLKAGSTTKVLDSAGTLGDIPGVTKVPPQDLAKWIASELKTEDVELSYYSDSAGQKSHIITVTGYYMQGGKHFLRYRDDEGQGSATSGDKAEKEGELIEKDGKYYFRRKPKPEFGVNPGLVIRAYSESVPQ
jgi:hypothetical protein